MNMMKTPGYACKLLVGLALGTALTGLTFAQEFKLAMSSPPTSMDPHFYNLTPNVIASGHMFEALVAMDPDSRLIPRLAESWSMVNDLTWEFKLRKGVKFHDGSELTAEDVLWSIERPATIVNSPGKFDTFTKAIVSKKIIDSHTIQFTTAEPYPLLLSDLAQIYIVSKKATQKIASDEFASGKGMVGTGPFRFARFVRDDRLELERNEEYWGKKAAWSKVTMRYIPNGTTRIAALLAGDVQAVENVPTADLPKVRGDSSLNLYSKVSHRLIYMYMDVKRDKSPFITDADGKPMEKNPLKDARVRHALSMAINREAIKDKIMEGLSVPTNNLVPISFFGFNPLLKDVKFDPEGAKKLIAEAGYPKGFGLTLHTPNNRYVNDERITQTVAQMFARIGVNTKVEAMPMSVYAGRGAKGDFSMGLLGWAAQTGEVSSPLRALQACENPAKGMGGFNWGRYCNPQMDELLFKGLNTVVNKDRLKLLQDAAAISINDTGLIPIHNQVTTWASKKGIVYTSRTDELTYAQEFRPQ